MYSFAKHSRLDTTTSLYSPHVIILEGILALHDQRVLDMLDMRVSCPTPSITWENLLYYITKKY